MVIAIITHKRELLIDLILVTYVPVLSWLPAGLNCTGQDIKTLRLTWARVATDQHYDAKQCPTVDIIASDNR